MDEQDKKIRHTISAEETFTLAKDVFDMRTFLKNAYRNRAIISRRINVVTLAVSMIFTILYVSFMLYRSLAKTVSFGTSVAIYAIIGVYVLMAVLLVIFFILSSRATTRSLKKFSLALKIIRIIVKLLSLAVSISAIAVAASGEGGAVDLAIDITLIVLSIIVMIIQLIPMFFGGIIKFVRWLLSPVKIKYRFKTVIIEWYKLITSGETAKGSKTKVAKKHYDHIGSLIDERLVPALGEKYINTIKPLALINLTEECPEEDRPVLEGILKSVFAYAAESGYVAVDPCRDLNFEGTIEEKQKKTVKERLLGMGTKIGKKVLDKYIAASSDEDDG